MEGEMGYLKSIRKKIKSGQIKMMTILSQSNPKCRMTNDKREPKDGERAEKSGRERRTIDAIRSPFLITTPLTLSLPFPPRSRSSDPESLLRQLLLLLLRSHRLHIKVLRRGRHAIPKQRSRLPLLHLTPHDLNPSIPRTPNSPHLDHFDHFDLIFGCGAVG